jgi:ribosomal protein S18 acetylase RimI-like enzyme
VIDHAAIEIAAEQAVPSEDQITIGMWRAHFSSGHIRRINSMSLHGERIDEEAAAVRLAVFQRLYRERGLKPRLRTTSMDQWICPLIRGWSEAGEALVMTSEPATADVGATISIEQWLDWLRPRAGAAGRFAEASSSARRLTADNVIVTTSVGNQIVGAARAVSTGGLTGLFDITVDPEHRRRGHARSMIRRLQGWAADRNEPVYLQVAVVNVQAIALYESDGFTERYRYRYRSPD